MCVGVAPHPKNSQNPSSGPDLSCLVGSGTGLVDRCCTPNRRMDVPPCVVVAGVVAGFPAESLEIIYCFIFSFIILFKGFKVWCVTHHFRQLFPATKLTSILSESYLMPRLNRPYNEE